MHKADSCAAPQPLSAEQARVFEHGVDFIAKLEGLEGRWREDWKHDLEQRVAWRTSIALVTVRTVRTDTTPISASPIVWSRHVDRVIIGKAPVRQSSSSRRARAAGFASLDQNRGALADQKFVAFVKWSSDDSGEPRRTSTSRPPARRSLTETESARARGTQECSVPAGARHRSYELSMAACASTSDPLARPGALCSLLWRLAVELRARRAGLPAPPVPLHPRPTSRTKAEAPKPSVDDTSFHLALESQPPIHLGTSAAPCELVLEARGGYHVNEDYPLRVDLKAPAAVKLTKAR